MAASLAGGVVEVRTLATDRVPPARWPALARLLDAEEAARARRFHFERDRRAYIAAHALLRCALAAHAGRPAADWRFRAGPFGKPAILDQPAGRDLRFSLSHTDGVVAVAVAEGADVGVDVEAIDCARAEPDLADAAFAPEEAAALRALPAGGAERCRRFFALWTLKEALVKAGGRGLSQPLDSFAFAFDPIRLTRLAPELRPAGSWHFDQWHSDPWSPGAAHVLALAVDAPGTAPPTVRRIPVEDAADPA